MSLRQVALGLALLALVPSSVATTGCGPANQYVVRGTERSVGVDGIIEITRTASDVNVVTVNLVNLPPPERHDRDKKTFVVWITPKDGAPIRAGSLDYDASNRRGSLRVTTPNDEVFVQVTAETGPRASAPSDFIVVSRHVTLKTGDKPELSAAR